MTKFCKAGCGTQIPTKYQYCDECREKRYAERKVKWSEKNQKYFKKYRHNQKIHEQLIQIRQAIKAKKILSSVGITQSDVNKITKINKTANTESYLDNFQQI